MHVGGRLRVHEQSNNEPVEPKDFGENENQNHSDKEFGLLRCAANAGVADNSDCET